MGIAETMIDKEIANRMKKRGMLWSKTGAWAMASLLMLPSTGTMLQWLEKHRDQAQPDPKARLGATTNVQTEYVYLAKSMGSRIACRHPTLDRGISGVKRLPAEAYVPLVARYSRVVVPPPG